MSSSIEQAESVWFIANPVVWCKQVIKLAKEKGYVHYGHGIVVENCRHIFRRELVGGIADEETRLADGTVTHNNASAGLIC